MEIALIPIPTDAKCQEASQFSVNSYVPCCQPAKTIVYHEKDGRGYWMCDMCADHNVHNRRGKLVSWSPTSIFAADPERRR